ncbi:hypothetical protein OH76DRAFT_1508542 [Lentinus brumalis]|uniref:Uncharacterized protein n=1 Tax=Lentinus brumalis TaxID=2498619 RepID=A0A371CIZ8_9APHY|nr:hypothetical protein OH76DRAFT_1508542 [Polyporus brumalis]
MAQLVECFVYFQPFWWMPEFNTGWCRDILSGTGSDCTSVLDRSGPGLDRGLSPVLVGAWSGPGPEKLDRSGLGPGPGPDQKGYSPRARSSAMAALSVCLLREGDNIDVEEESRRMESHIGGSHGAAKCLDGAPNVSDDCRRKRECGTDLPMRTIARSPGVRTSFARDVLNDTAVRVIGGAACDRAPSQARRDAARSRGMVSKRDVSRHGQIECNRQMGRDEQQTLRGHDSMRHSQSLEVMWLRKSGGCMSFSASAQACRSAGSAADGRRMLHMEEQYASEGAGMTDVLHVAVMDNRKPSRPIRIRDPVRGGGGAT